MLGKRSNKSLSNKTLADSFHNDELSCFLAAQSAQKNVAEKAYTLSHLSSYSTELNNNSPDYRYQAVLSTGSKEVICMTSSPESTQQSLLTSGPPQIPSEQDNAERK